MLSSHRNDSYVIEQLETRRLLSIAAPPTIRLPDVPGVSDGIVNPVEFGVDLADNGNDDTAALQAAIYAAVDTNDNRVLYLPAGTYNVSDTLWWEKTPNGGDREWTCYFSIIGENRDTTIIKMADNGYPNPPNYDPSNFHPNAVFYTAAVNGVNSGYDPVTGSSNAAFQNSIWNLTIDVGSNNPGVVGIDYHVTNQGSIKDVRIISTDATKHGYAGIRMSRGIIGPGLIKNVEVDGFELGMFFQNMQTVMTLEHINLLNQREYGLYVKGTHLAARDITSNNTVTAIQMQIDDASLTQAGSTLSLIDSNLIGGSGANDAINAEYRCVLHVRNTTTQGYATSIDNNSGSTADAPTGYVREYVTHDPHREFTNSPFATLNLPIRETPTYWGGASDWANVLSYGATPNDGTDDTTAIRAAIASGKSMIFFPEGHYLISDTIDVGGAVRKMYGPTATFSIYGSGPLASASSGSMVPAFRIVNAAHSNPIIMQGISPRLALNPAGTVQFEHKSQNAFVLSDTQLSTGTTYRLRTSAPASGTLGDLFLEDVGSGASGDAWKFEVGGQNIFARQLDVEGSQGITNAGANLWILGLKTEGAFTIIDTTGGGKTEVLGGMSYPGPGVNTDSIPAFRSTDSQISIAAYANDDYVAEGFYNILVQEIRGGVTQNYRQEKTVNEVFCRIPMYSGFQHTGNGLNATYYNNSDFTGTTVSRTDATVNFSWGSGSPHASIGSDTFSARWTGQIQALETGNYLFKTDSDDGVRLYVNNVLVINNWTNHSLTTNTSANVALVAGEKYDIRLEYFENTGSSTIRLKWVRPGIGTTDVIPQSQLFTTYNTLKGTYRFNDSLAGNEPSSPTLSAVNPLGLNAYETQNVFGSPRRVYKWDGSTASNAGLSLNTTGKLTSNDTYSVEIVFQFTEGAGTWRRILNAGGTSSDYGLYLDNTNRVFLYGPGGNVGTTTVNTNKWHHLVMTNNGGFCKVYIDGVVQFGLPVNVMNITDPSGILRLFIDNTTEYADGRIALLRLHNSVLTDSQIIDRAMNPFSMT